MKYNLVVLGGTFDHFHAGHKAILDKAFAIGKEVEIGLTSDKMIQLKPMLKTILPIKVRQAELVKYLEAMHFQDRANIILIDDIFGNTLTEKKYEVIVVSPETEKTAKMINKIRKKRGLPKMDIVLVPFIRSADKKALSSFRIRSGEINTTGELYELPALKGKFLPMPETIRAKLREPLGEVFRGTEFAEDQTMAGVVKKILTPKPPMIITVGDIVSISLQKQRVEPDLKIIDFRSRKQSIEELYSRVNFSKSASVRVKNSPGTISKIAAEAVRSAIKCHVLKNQKGTIIVAGEEDLLTLPAILFSPLGSVVLYGQFDLGVVAVTVTESKKTEALHLLRLFK